MRRRPAAGPPDLVRREEALDHLRSTLQQFVIALGRIMAGHPATFGESASPEVVAHVLSALEPLLTSRLRVSPDFGQYGELRIEGDLLADRPVLCWLRFSDQSELHNANGSRLSVPRRRVELQLLVSIRPYRVERCSVQAAA